MKKRELQIYLTLVCSLAVLASISVFLPQGDFAASVELPAPRPVLALINALASLIVYGGLGYLGLRLAASVGFATLWDDRVTNRQRFLWPLILGLLIGSFFIVVERLLLPFHAVGPLPHPPFPTSLTASAAAAIGEEILFRLFLVSLGVYLLGKLLTKETYREPVFWTVTAVSGLLFALAHLPSLMFMLELDDISAIPAALLVEMLILNGSLSLVAGYNLKKYGIVAAMGIHFWTDVLWHVLYGAWQI